MYEDALKSLDFTNEEISNLVAQYSKTSIDDLKLSIGLRYFIKKADSIPDLILSIEAISNGLGLRLRAVDQIKMCLKNYLSEEDKIGLLKEWAFSDKYQLGGEIGEYKHLMKGDQKADIKWHKINDERFGEPDEECYTGENWFCQCEDWLRDNNQKLDYYLELLAEKFYAMRCAMYHNAFPIFIADTFEENEKVTSYEVYLHGSNELESFMTDRTFKEMNIACSG